VIDVAAFRMLLLVVTGWLERRERDAIAYLIEENRLLHPQLGGRRLRLTDADRRRLAARAHGLGRRVLRDVATIETPDTLLRWHRQLIAQKWTSARRRPCRRGGETGHHPRNARRTDAGIQVVQTPYRRRQVEI
jgi:hypothetical protein